MSRAPLAALAVMAAGCGGSDHRPAPTGSATHTATPSAHAVVADHRDLAPRRGRIPPLLRRTDPTSPTGRAASRRWCATTPCGRLGVRDVHRALVSREFAGRMVVVDLIHERVTRTIPLKAGAMPQDVKLSPDGRTFYVADMASNGVWLIDAHTWRKIRFQPTGPGAHGLYPSRDSRKLYVSNRAEGSITVISFRTRRRSPSGGSPAAGSPDMGGVSANRNVLWLSGRYNAEVYAISTRTGRLLHRIRVGQGPHGLCV